MPADDRAVRIAARSLVRDLAGRGHDARDVVALAAELLDLAADQRAARRLSGRR